MKIDEWYRFGGTDIPFKVDGLFRTVDGTDIVIAYFPDTGQTTPLKLTPQQVEELETLELPEPRPQCCCCDAPDPCVRRCCCPTCHSGGNCVEEE